MVSEAEVLSTRKGLVVLVVGTGILMSALDGSIVNIALPTLQTELSTSFAALQWIVLIYMLVLVVFIPTAGRLGDSVSRKSLYVCGLSTFTLSSLLCGLSPNLEWLLVARALQGVGAAINSALGLAVLTQAFPEKERGRALGIASALMSIGLILGPSIGSAILDALSWHWLFLVNVPVGLAATCLAVRYIPSSHDVASPRHFDAAGAISLGATLAAFLIAITLMQLRGFSSFWPWLAFFLSAAGAAGFVFFERQAPEPTVDFGLLRRGLLTQHLAELFLCFFTLSGLVYLMPFYLRQDLGLSTADAGILLAVAPAVVGLAGPATGHLADRFGNRGVTRLGLFSLMGAYALLGTLTSSTTPSAYAARMACLGLALAVFQSPNNSTIMSAVPPERLTMASSLLVLARILGQVTGASVLGAAWAWRATASPSNSAALMNADPSSRIAALRLIAWVCVALIAGTLCIALRPAGLRGTQQR